MTYACVQDITNPTTSPIIGLFNMPQSDPDIIGYIGKIDITDSRIATFIASIIALPK